MNMPPGGYQNAMHHTKLWYVRLIHQQAVLNRLRRMSAKHRARFFVCRILRRVVILSVGLSMRSGKALENLQIAEYHEAIKV